MRDSRDRAVVGGGADRGVKGGVLDEAGPALGDLFRLLFEDPLHLGDLLEGRAARGEGRDAGLKEAARLEELGDRLALRDHHERERLDQRLDRDLANERALARPDLDQAEALQRPQRLTNRGATHDELLGEIALGREPVAALEPTLGDHLLDLANDLLVDPRRLDRGDLHRPLSRRLVRPLRLRWPRVSHRFSGTLTRWRCSRANHQPHAVTTRPMASGTG